MTDKPDRSLVLFRGLVWGMLVCLWAASPPGYAWTTLTARDLTWYQMYTPNSESGAGVVPTTGTLNTIFIIGVYNDDPSNDQEFPVSVSLLINRNEVNLTGRTSDWPPSDDFDIQGVFYIPGYKLAQAGGGLGTTPADFTIVARRWYADQNGNLNNTDTTLGTVRIWPQTTLNHFSIPVADPTGTTHKSRDTSSSKLNGHSKGGLIVDPVDPINDDEGTTSSAYNFRLRFQHPDALPPQPFKQRAGGNYGPYPGDPNRGDNSFNSGVAIVLDGVEHDMVKEADLASDEAVWKYVVRPSNMNVAGQGEWFDNNYFALGPGYHYYYYKFSTSIVGTVQNATIAGISGDTLRLNTNIIQVDDQYNLPANSLRLAIYPVINGQRVEREYLIEDTLAATNSIKLNPFGPNTSDDLAADGIRTGNPVIIGAFEYHYEDGRHPFFWHDSSLPFPLNPSANTVDPSEWYWTYVNFGLRFAGVTESGTPNAKSFDVWRRFDPFGFGGFPSSFGQYIFDWNPLDSRPLYAFLGGQPAGDGDDPYPFEFDPDVTDPYQYMRGTLHSRSRGGRDTQWTFWANFVGPQGSVSPNTFGEGVEDQAPARVRLLIYREDGTLLAEHRMVRAPAGGTTPQRSPNNNNYSDNYSDKYAFDTYNANTGWTWHSSLRDNWSKNGYDYPGMARDVEDNYYWNQNRGEWYYFTRNLPEGRYTYIIEADDTVRTTIYPRRPNPSTPYQSYAHDVNVAQNRFYDLRVNRKPTLANSSVTPTSGPMGARFTFRVTYTDADGDEPRDAWVNIITVPKRPAPAGLGGSTTLTDPNSPNWEVDHLTGAFVDLYDAGDNAIDLDGNPLDLFEDNKTDARQVNLPRVVSNTADTITVDRPFPSNVASYRIRLRATMTLESGSYSTGAVYKYEYNQFPNPGTYQYYFRFVDNWGDRVVPEPGEFASLPMGDAEGRPSSSISGPVVIRDNAPILFVSLDDVRDPDDPSAFGADGNVTDDDQWLNTVTWPGQPANPTPATLIIYRVVYYDKDNTPPAYVRVIIDGIGYDMTKLDPNDNTYNDGVVYQYQTKLSVLPGDPPPAHTVQYYASDGIRGNLYPDPNDADGDQGALQPQERFEPELNTAQDFSLTVPPGQSATYTPSTPTPVVVPNQAPVLVTNADSNTLAVTAGAGTPTVTVDREFATNALVGLTLVAINGVGNPTLLSIQSNTGSTITAAAPVPADTVQVGLRDPNVDALNPDIGNSTTNFAYQVRYFDANNQPPDVTTGGFIRVFIDGVAHDMAKVNPTDNEFRDGVLYTYSTPLPSGSHKYHFETSDGDASVRLPVNPNVEFPGPTVNDPPVLSLESVSPATGGQLTNYTYRVTFTDLDNDAPDANMPELWIDAREGQVTDLPGAAPVDTFIHNIAGIEAGSLVGLDLKFLSGASAGAHFTVVANEAKTITLDAPANIAPNDRFEVGRLRVMGKVDPGDNNYADGADYFYLTTDVFAVGTHTYHFEVTAAGSGDRHPDTGEFTGPLVDANIAPTLSGGAVSPTQGTTATKYRWTVTYSDADNDDPFALGPDGQPRGYVRVHIKDGTGNEITGSPFLMQQENPGDRNFVDGAAFFYESTSINEGPHTFHFEVTDGLISVATPEQNGPTVNYKPQLLNPTLIPSGRGTTSTLWTWSVTYQDLDGDMPQLAGSPSGVQVVINGTSVNMTQDPGTTDPKQGLLFTYTQRMQEGQHNYFFRSSDGKENVRNPDFTSIPGTATAVQGQVMTDDNANFTPNRFVGMVLRWLDGPEKDAEYQITANTEKTITVARDFQGAVAGNRYEVRGVYFGPAVNFPPQLSEGSVTTQVPGVVGTVAGDIVTVTEETGNYHPTINFAGRTLQWTSGALQGVRHLIEGNTAMTLDLDADVQAAGAKAGDTFRILDVPVTARINRSTNVYRFRVKFTDRDYDLPGQIQVFINELDPPGNAITANLVEEDPSDKNTKDGKVYIYEADPAQGKGLRGGAHEFHFEANDGLQTARWPSTGDQAGPQVNYPPVLKNVQLDPRSGQSSTPFTYSGVYADEDDVASKAPEAVVLYIDRGIAGEERRRVLTPTGTQSWRAGRPFSQVETGLTSGRRHSYFILASDGVENTSVGPIQEPLVNALPVLNNASVSPAEGPFKGDYTFQVDFYDPDGFDPVNPPPGNPQGFVQVVIDKGAPLDLVDTGTGSFGTPPGRRYQLVQSGATLGAGEHYFYFRASDGFDMDGDGQLDVVLGDANAANDPAVDPFTGPKVHAVPQLINGAVSPNPGTTGDTYTYQITYKDADGDLPQAGQPVLHVRGPQNQDLPMSWSGGAGDPPAADIQAGTVYEAQLSGLAPGTYSFSIEVEDAWGDTAESDAIPGPPADPYSGPRVNNKPTLSDGSVTPLSGTSTQVYRWEVLFKDLDGEAPRPGEPVVEITGADTLTGVMQKVDPTDNDFAGAGVRYYYERQLSSGSHAWTIRASDGLEQADPLSGSGPQVNFPPALPSATVDPLDGLSTDSYRYHIEVHDTDGTAPDSLSLIIEDLDEANQVTRTRTIDLLTDPQVTDDGKPYNGANGAGRTFTYTVSAAELGSGRHRFQARVVNGAGEQVETPWINGPRVNRKPVLSEGRVLPPSGASTATYTYRVKYQDGDGTEPASIMVKIGGSDNLIRNLARDPAGGTDIRQGVEYFVSLAPLSSGPHTFEFSATDGQEEADKITGPEPTVNFAPVLSNGAVTPTSGTQATEFVFTVNFRDSDNVDPAAQGGGVKLYLDRGTSRERVLNMTPLDTDFTKTVTYQSKVQNLQPSAEGAHSFQFEANDGVETVTSPLVTNQPVVNAPPVFEDLKVVWFDAQGREQVGDDPQRPAPAGTEFTFSGLYKDPDGTPPRYVKLFVDDPTEAGDGLQMVNTDPSPNYRTGALFSVKWTPSTQGPHRFHVRVDDRTESLRVPETAEREGPFLNERIQLTGGQVTPQQGREKDPYEFSVQYSDPEGTAPSGGVKLLVEVAGATVEKVMASDVANPTPDQYKTGVLFRYKTAAGEIPPGTHLFRFWASDGVNTPTQTVPQTVQINYAPTVTDPSVSPQKGSEQTTFLWSATVTDKDGGTPTVELTIDGQDPVGMSPASGGGDLTQGLVYEYRSTLAAGSHLFKIRVNDGFDEATTAELGGPTVGHAPLLSDGEATPQTGTEATEFLFRVTYWDRDNDAPEFIQVVLGEVAYLMQPVDPTDLNYINGKRYEYRTKLKSGQLKYRFKASDGMTTVETAEADGPVVTKSPLLVPGTGSVTPTQGDTNTKYRFQVTFLHPENDPPTEVVVFIDGHPFAMSKLDPQDLNFTDGVVYSYEADPDLATPSGLSAGTHTFHFEATADGLSLREPGSGEQTGPVVAQGATLRLTLPETLQLGELLRLEGQLLQQPNAEIKVNFRDPQGSSSEITLTADSEGRFAYNRVLRQSGDWQVTVSWSGNAQFGPVVRPRMVQVKPATLLLPSGLQLLSIPVAPRDPRTEVIFGTDLVVKRWDPQSGQYLTVGQEGLAALLQPGVGIWVKLPAAATATADGTAADPSNAFEIPVRRGWNMIGNPFLTTFDWAAAQVRFQGQTVSLAQAQQNGWTSSYAWYYRPTTQYGLVHGTAANAVRGVRPWEGLWFRAFVDCTLILNPVAFQGEATPTRGRFLAGDGAWTASLVATAAGCSDAFNYFGAGASAEEPLHHLETPPLPAGYVDVSFVNVPVGSHRLPEHRATDIRVGDAPRLVWDVVVRTDLAHEEITLTWPDLSGVPANYRLTLTDLETGEAVFLRTRSHYRFDSGEGGIRRFRLVAEKGQQGSLRPTTFRVDPPLPGRAMGSVTFTLPREAVVDVDILTPTTQTVLRSIARSRAVGNGWNELPWDGRDAAGRPLPNGTYLARLIVRGPDGEQVQEVTTFTILR